MAIESKHTNRVEVRLSNITLEALNKAAKKLNISKSQLIRESINKRLEELKINS